VSNGTWAKTIELLAASKDKSTDALGRGQTVFGLVQVKVLTPRLREMHSTPGETTCTLVTVFFLSFNKWLG
jgi:hypothetical protein